MAEPRKGWEQPCRPPSGQGSGRGVGNRAGGSAVTGPRGSGRGERGRSTTRSRSRKKVCTKCGRFTANACQHCPEPHSTKYYGKDVVTYRPCTSITCMRLNFFLNPQCYGCGTLFPARDDDAQHPLSTSRGMAAMNRATQRQDAAKTLQRWVRGTRQLRLYRRLLARVVVIQAVCRGAAARRHLAKSRAAAVCVQTLFRGVMARAQWARMRRAAVRLQARVRLRAAAATFRRERTAVFRLQAVWRGAAARRHLEKSRAAAVRMQAFIRGVVVRAQWARMRRAAVRLQARVRLRAAASMFRRERTAVVTAQAVWRGVAARRSLAKSRAAAVLIQSLARGATARARQVRMNRAAVRLQAHLRCRAAAAMFRRERDAAIAVQAKRRGMLARRHFSKLKKAARRRKTFGVIGSLVALAIVAAIMVGLLFGGASPCQRGGALSPGDAPLAPGECIEGATGSRLFGWIPGVSARAKLSVTRDGRMVATKPNGAEVVLAGHIPIDGRNGELICGAERIARIVAGKNEPGYGARNARGQLVLGKEYHCSVYRTSGPKDVRGRLEAWLERGGYVGFSPDGDLEVVSSKGSVWWSLAKELAEDDVKKARAGSAEPSRGGKEEKRKGKEKEKDTKKQNDRNYGGKIKKDKSKASTEPDRPGREGGRRKWPWNR